jgi:helix-turn-helix protein
MASIEVDRWQWRELFASEHGPADYPTRLVLFVLSLHMGHDGDQAWPSQETIAKRAGLSDRAVRKHIALAQESGWLRVEPRRQHGQAWFVHEYTAMIPENLAQFCTARPWEEDPTWKRPERRAGRRKQRAEPGAGRQSSERDYVAEKGGVVANSEAMSPSVDKTPRRPEPGARRAEPGAATGGTPCRDARHAVPTNSSSNSSINSSSECAVASDHTALGRILNGKLNGKAVEQTRADKIRLAKLGIKKGLDAATIQRQYGLTIEEVEREALP